MTGGGWRKDDEQKEIFKVDDNLEEEVSRLMI